jgi:hypothetical protein
MTNDRENIVDRIKRESAGFAPISPKLVAREKATRDRYILALTRKLGRPLTKEEWVSLSNIL